MPSTRCCPRIRATLFGAAFSFLAASLTSPTAALAQRPLEPKAAHQNLASVVDLIDIRDTTAKQAFELVLEAGNAQFALRDDIGGTARIKASGRTVEECLTSLRADNPQALISSVENGVYFLRPSMPPIDHLLAHPRHIAVRATPKPHSTAHEPTSLAEVHRRVGGIVIVHGGPSYALLETDTLSPQGPDIRVVSWGPNNARKEPTLVPSGVAAIPDLTVAKIDATGVTLTAEDGTLVHVALASAAYSPR